MSRAWIDGKPVARDAASAEAAKLLGASRLPLVAGLATDVAGARAAVALAERLGGVVDHLDSDSLITGVTVLAESGTFQTTASEARIRADFFLLIGAAPASAPPGFLDFLFGASQPNAGRRVVWLCPGRARAVFPDRVDVQRIGGDPGELPILLGALRACIGGRPVGATRPSARTLDALAGDLKAARFGVALWSASGLDALTIEMLCGLVNDLNGATRFTGLPLPSGDNGPGVLEVCGWMSGFPVRTGFGRGYPEHDPWRFDGRRLVDSGEADCVLWISAYRAAAPDWAQDVPTIALARSGTHFRAVPRVHFEVGGPGIDHDSVEHIATTGMLGAVAASRPGEAPSVADVVAEIAAALPDSGARPC